MRMPNLREKTRDAEKSKENHRSTTAVSESQQKVALLYIL